MTTTITIEPVANRPIIGVVLERIPMHHSGGNVFHHRTVVLKFAEQTNIRTSSFPSLYAELIGTASSGSRLWVVEWWPSSTFAIAGSTLTNAQLPIDDSNLSRDYAVLWQTSVLHNTSALPVSALHPVVQEFAEGIDGICPAPDVAAIAERIVQAAIEKTVEPEFLVDSDGALSIDLRLVNGLRALAELTIDGILDAGFYDDSDSSQHAVEVEYMPQAMADEIIRLF